MTYCMYSRYVMICLKISDHAFGMSLFQRPFFPHVGMLPGISHNMACDDINSSQRPVKDSIELGLTTEMTRRLKGSSEWAVPQFPSVGS